jgi:hypothetical protein
VCNAVRERSVVVHIRETQEFKKLEDFILLGMCFGGAKKKEGAS